MAGATTQAQRQQEVLAAGYNGPLTDAAINQAYANAATASDLAQSGISNKPQTATSGTVTNAAAASNAGSAQLQAGIQGLLAAAASGNKDAINEQIREWNQTFGLDQSKFNDDVRRFNENLAISQSGLTGTYQGQQTQQAQAQAFAQQQALAGMYGQGYANFGQVPSGQQTLEAQAQAFAQQQALAGMYGQGYANFGQVPLGQQTLEAQQQAYAQQLGLINQAASLQANPFRQQQAIGQMSRLLGGGGVAGFSAPNTVAGVGVAGGNTQGGMGYLQQMIDDIRDPTANQASMNQVMQGIPTPNKLNSNEFLRAAPSTQSMVLQGMQEKYGIDPADALNQIKATLPQFTAPTTMGTIRR